MLTADTLFESALVTVRDYRCDAGPGEPPFTEVHDGYVLSFVREGTFGYRIEGRQHDLVSGAVLAGFPGAEYVCSHEHHVCGDECLSFHFGSGATDVLGLPPSVWEAGAVPPVTALMVAAELAQAAAIGACDVAPEEAALLFAAAFGSVAGGRASSRRSMRPRDRRRAIDVALWLDSHCHEAIDLERIAAMVSLSPLHFLRVFARVVGVTPHQYLLRSRVRRAARLLACSEAPVTDIALDVGFNDLSNFVRTFHRAAGMSPRRFRVSSRAAGSAGISKSSR